MLSPATRKQFFAIFFLAVICAGALSTPASSEGNPPHNVILFIPDGLRPGTVRSETAPTFAQIRDQGVNFDNSHAIFPTLTMVNSATMGTGHFPGDMGNFANTVYTGFPVISANGTVVPMIENDAILSEVNAGFGGNYLNEESLLAAARKAGFSTASIGKVGPVAVYDITERSGEQTIIIDDLTGRSGGLPLSHRTLEALHAAGLATVASARGDNAKVGNANAPGTTVANVEQQRYFVDVTTKSILPMFKAAAKPFVLVFWSRDPDGTQHNQGDSLGS